jgi:three-Cys-motif partner protein
VKHYFLENYLERLIHKTASRYDEIVYVDGFSGPWQSRGENYQDTSFGIALSALRKAKASWRDRGRTVRMAAYLIERNRSAFGELSRIPARFPDVDVHTVNDDFVQFAPRLLKQIPAGAFAFVLIDPKGWRIPISQLGALLGRANTEVVFTFMFDFINRAASIDAPKIIEGLAELMPHGTWRERLAAIHPESTDTSELRRAVLVEGFSESLATIGHYQYVAEIPILRPLKNRILYSLFYATRHPAGIQVFRDCQLKTLREEAAVRGVAKRNDVRSKTGQEELFSSEVQMAPSEIEAYLEAERTAAQATVLQLTPASPASVSYGDIWPRVLARHAVTKAELNKMMGKLRKDGSLIFHEWAPRKQVPDDHYRTSLAR